MRDAAATIHETGDSTGPIGDGASRDLRGPSAVLMRGGDAIRSAVRGVVCRMGGDIERVLAWVAVGSVGVAAESVGSALATPRPTPVIPAPMPSASVTALILLATPAALT